MRTFSIVSGGFDPIHIGHVRLIQAAAQIAPVIVLLNDDEWLIRKKGKPFMTWDERKEVLLSISGVNQVIPAGDPDGSVLSSLKNVAAFGYDLTFVNGGDRKATNTPEIDFCYDAGIRLVWGAGGEKAQSSSDLLTDWDHGRVDRKWGHWSVLRKYPASKLKELVVNPGKHLSLQRHHKRAEYWFVAEGEGFVDVDGTRHGLRPGNRIDIPIGSWHQLFCDGPIPLRIIEIQHGRVCEESDIERK